LTTAEVDPHQGDTADRLLSGWRGAGRAVSSNYGDTAAELCPRPCLDDRTDGHARDVMGTAAGGFCFTGKIEVTLHMMRVHR